MKTLTNPYQASDFGRVAVLYGGDSAEREVSLISGQAVLGALTSAGVQVTGIDQSAAFIPELSSGKFDRVFMILHGRGGEDGQLQGVLESLAIPYTGSDVLGSALCMDKYRCKLLWQALSIPTPDFALISSESDLEHALQSIGFPAFVKPVHEGSSIGMSPVDNAQQLHEAWVKASHFDSEVLVERRINGPEYTVGLLADDILPIIRLEAARTFYDYEAKYADETETQYHLPCGLDEQAEKHLGELCQRAFRAAGGSGWGRVDVLCDEAGQAYLIDANTAPGMTPHSLIPMAAQSAGLDFQSLVLRILGTTL